jgi:hypothetical protein
MTLDDLRTGLGILKPGQMLSVSYAVYELIFPPGQPDELARTRAWALAEEYGCTIKNLPSEKRVLFLKPKPPTNAVLPPGTRQRFVRYTWEELFRDHVEGIDDLRELATYLQFKSANCGRAFKRL